jgi:4-hydroxyphenylpyruvate dioxygenase-like putative hemolysin
MRNKDSWRPRLDELNKCLLKALNDYVTFLQEIRSDPERSTLRLEMKESLSRLGIDGSHEGDGSLLLGHIARIIVDHGLSKLDESGDGSLKQAVRIDHLAIAVRDLDEAILFYSERYGFRQADRRVLEGTNSAMEYAVMAAGEVTLVLVMGLDPKSNVSRYIDHYGPGVQHVAIQVHGLKAVLSNLTARKADMLTDIIRAPGLLQTFTRRDQNSGMQFEFIERTTNNEFDENSVKELYDAMDRDDVY